MSKDIELVGQNECTSCGVCMLSCPTKSIKMISNEMDFTYPKIDETSCIHCSLCTKVCPADKEWRYETYPDKVYAAWSLDETIRKKSASGGVASAIYSYALTNDIKIFGVKSDPDGNSYFIEINSSEDIELCRNSKYTFSDITTVLQVLKKYVISGQKVILIALPCQSAAVLGYLGKRYDNLLIVDIVCHGVPSSDYLKQHIMFIENKKRKKNEEIRFRDPNFGTEKFIFSMYNNNEIFYKCGVYKNDLYQIGYHKSLIYRDNCYNCKYASFNRVGDITISDFPGVGKMMPFNFEKNSVSCVLISSSQGVIFIDTLVEKGYLYAEKRPVEEALDYEKMLSAPSIPHKNLEVFRLNYKKSKNFEYAAKCALKKDIRKNMLRYYLAWDKIKIVLSKCLPKKIKIVMKRIIKKL